MHVTIPNPDAPFDSPAFDGDPADAHKRLAPGQYRCGHIDSKGNDHWGTVTVTEDASHFTPGGATKPVGELVLGDRISLCTDERPWHEFNGPRDVTFTNGAIERRYDFDSATLDEDHGGYDSGIWITLWIRTDDGKLHERRGWDWDELADLALDETFPGDDPWTDSYGNKYSTYPAASTIVRGADIMLTPGTTFTYEDTSEYEPTDGMPANGETSEATDMHEGGPVYGKVEAVKLVGDRVHLTIADHPAPAWTFSISAHEPVHVA